METPDIYDQTTLLGTIQSRHRRISDLFLEALECVAAERTVFLDQKCGDDAALRRELEEMLAAHSSGGDFLDKPILGDGLKAIAELKLTPPDQKSLIGQIIGKCQVIREIGRGGMGVVYEVKRTDMAKSKPLALKVLKRGMDTDAIVHRFRREYRILASLEHPNIARLLDGGATNDGTPFFLMDLIEGWPIVAYCDERKLNVVKRLELFRKVCDAVQYAHRNLIVHRDIKPSNILVTADGSPKLLDFGIAKVLHAEGESGETAVTDFDVTKLGQQVMTPAYASPEQMRGDGVTTSIDIYALGILLYELLTGRLPYRFSKNSFEELRRIVCESEPERPSAAALRQTDASDALFSPLSSEEMAAVREGTPDRLSRRLAGDLDKILLKALSKEPSRRFASVEQFSDDIQRHLDGLPVAAQTDAFMYRAGKFIRRNRVSLTAGALIAVSALGGGTAAAWQKVRAERERGRAETQRRLSEALVSDVRDMANSLLYKIHDQVEKLPGSTPVRETLVKEALTYLDRLSRQAGEEPTLQREVALAYRRVGDVQGRPYVPNLGDTSGALASYQKSLGMLESLAALSADDATAQAELATAYERTGEVLGRMGNSAAALERYTKTQSVRERLVASQPENKDYRRTLADCYTHIGDEMCNAEDFIGALDLYGKVLEMRQNLLSSEPQNERFQQNLTTVQVRLAATLKLLGDFGEEKIGTGVWTGDIYNQALAYHMEALKFAKAKAAHSASQPDQVRSLAAEYMYVGEILLKLGKSDDAIKNFQKALSGLSDVSASDPKNIEYQAVLALTHRLIGDALRMVGEDRRTEKAYQKALALYEKLAANDQANNSVRRQFANLRMEIGKNAFAKMQFSRATEYFKKSLEVYDQALLSEPKALSLRSERSQAALLYAQALIKSGKDVEGRTIIVSEFTFYKFRSEQLDISARELSDYAWLLLTCDLPDLKNTQEGLVYAQRAVSKSRGRNVSAMLVLASAYFSNGDLERGEETVRKLFDSLPTLDAKHRESPLLDVQRRLQRFFTR